MVEQEITKFILQDGKGNLHLAQFKEGRFDALGRVREVPWLTRASWTGNAGYGQLMLPAAKGWGGFQAVKVHLQVVAKKIETVSGKELKKSKGWGALEDLMIHNPLK